VNAPLAVGHFIIQEQRMQAARLDSFYAELPKFDVLALQEVWWAED
jgi:hypothetical protein